MGCLQLNPRGDGVAGRLEDSKGHLLRLLLRPKLKASVSFCEVGEMEPTCPEGLLCLRYLGTSADSLLPFLQHEEGTLTETALFLLEFLVALPINY